MVKNGGIKAHAFTFLHAAAFEMCVAALIIYRNEASLSEEKFRQTAIAESIFLIAENALWAVHNIVILGLFMRQARHMSRAQLIEIPPNVQPNVQPNDE